MREVFTWEVSCFVSVKGVEAKTVGCNSEYGNTSSTETRLTRLPTKKTQTNLACTFKSHYYFWELWLWGQVHILFKYFKTWIFANHFCCLFCMSYSFKHVWTWRKYCSKCIVGKKTKLGNKAAHRIASTNVVPYIGSSFKSGSPRVEFDGPTVNKNAEEG